LKLEESRILSEQELKSSEEQLFVGESQVTLTTLLSMLYLQEYFVLIRTWRTTQENSTTTIHIALILAD